jgi:hypothetical protein
LVEYLVRGVVDGEAIATELKASRFFVTVADEQPWRTVWHWFERTDAEFNAALPKMEQQFKNREFVVSGEILHVMGLRLFLADQGILKLTKAEAVAEGKKYIDELYAAKKLRGPTSDDSSEIRFQGWGGLGICEHETAEYRSLYDHLMEMIQRSVNDSYPDKAKHLLSDMKSDVEKFYRQVALSHADASDYVRAPVLAVLPVEEFVDALLALHPSSMRLAMVALKGRYEYGRLDQTLKDEKPWIVAVFAAIQKRLPQMSAISRRRFGMLLEWYPNAVKSAPAAEESDS